MKQGKLKKRPSRGRQHTVRAVPAHVDRILRERARAEGKSLNEVLVEALTKGSGAASETATIKRDLEGIAGSWVADPAFDEAIREQDQVDESMWR